MSVALGEDSKNASIQLGKALNDPILGITSLKRVGVSFTQSQKDQIKVLVESGHKMKAQKLILKELQTEFGGAAAAAATPMDKLKATLQILSETIGRKVIPFVDKGAKALQGLIVGFQNGTGPGGKLAEIFHKVVDAVRAGLPMYIADRTPQRAHTA